MKPLKLARVIMSLPRVTINLSGDDACHQLFADYTKRHPKYKVIRNKSLGAALILLPETFDDYLAGRPKSPMRKKRKRAISSGYRFEMFNPSSHIEEILQINMSLEERQERPMPDHYRDAGALAEYFHDKPQIYGIFDTDDSLKAYSHAILCGDVFAFQRILGHGDDLSMGIMYLLVGEMVRTMIEKKQKDNHPVWVMYDTYFGALPGLRIFKRNTGFEPYYVHWQWSK